MRYAAVVAVSYFYYRVTDKPLIEQLLYRGTVSKFGVLSSILNYRFADLGCGLIVKSFDH